MSKKQEQLGMNPSTASGRLLKDLLFDFVIKSGHKCYQCNEELTRETFSIEHKKPWLDSKNPKKVYFDLDNIAFSHLSCNIRASRPGKELSHPSVSSYQYGCRCDECKKIKMAERRKERQRRKNKLSGSSTS